MAVPRRSGEGCSYQSAVHPQRPRDDTRFVEIQRAEFPVRKPCNEVARLNFITYYVRLISYMKPSENVCSWLKIFIGVEQILPAEGAESVPPIRGRLAAGPLDACVRPGSVAVAEPEAVPSGGEYGT